MVSIPPPAQRHSATSQAAAAAIAPDAETLRQLVRRAIENAPDGLTDEEGIAVTGIAANTYRPRRVECVRLKWIMESGKTRKTVANRQAVVWVATPPKVEDDSTVEAPPVP